MAIINEGNGKYLRLFLDRSYMLQNGVYTYILEYRGLEDRNKEKEREPLWDTFEHGLRNAIVAEDERVQEYVSQLDHMISYFRKYCIGYEGLIDEPRYTEEAYAVAEEFGFDIEWFNDPVILYGETILRVDNYEGQEFDTIEFYNKIKAQLMEDDENIVLVDDL